MHNIKKTERNFYKHIDTNDTYVIEIAGDGTLIGSFGPISELGDILYLCFMQANGATPTLASIIYAAAGITPPMAALMQLTRMMEIMRSRLVFTSICIVIQIR